VYRPGFGVEALVDAFLWPLATRLPITCPLATAANFAGLGPKRVRQSAVQPVGSQSRQVSTAATEASTHLGKIQCEGASTLDGNICTKADTAGRGGHGIFRPGNSSCLMSWPSRSLLQSCPASVCVCPNHHCRALFYQLHLV
jgi:hypothetical protein